MRWLFLADLVITALIGILLLTSPATFAYYRFGWLALVGGSALVFVLARRRCFWLLIGLSALGLPAAWIVLPPHYGAFDLLLILWTLGVLPLVSAGLIGSIAPPRSLLRRELLAAVIALGVFVNLRSIHAFPNFSATDEAIIFDYVDTFERSGKIEASLVPYDAPTVTGNLYVYAAEFWLRLFPGDSFALRDFSALGSLALIVVVFLAARALADTLSALMAAALLSTNLLWIAVAHIGRQEVWLAVFVWAAFWLSLEARRRRSPALALLAGLIVALSADVHPLGVYACIAFGVWWLSFSWKGVALRFAFIFGGLIGTAYYLAAHVLPDPVRFLAALHDELVSSGAEGWSPLAAMIARHASYAVSNPLELVTLLIAALATIRTQRRLALLVGVLLLLYTFTVADPNLYYPIVWITGIVILAALTVRRAAWHWRVPLLVAFMAAFALNLVLIDHAVSVDWNDQALAAIQQVAAQVPTSGRGLGESFLYLALRDPDFIGFTFVDFWAAGAGMTRWAVVKALKPDWIVTMRDQQAEQAFTPEFSVLGVDVPHMHLRLPDTGLERDYRLAADVPTSVGEFEIWQIGHSHRRG